MPGHGKVDSLICIVLEVIHLLLVSWCRTKVCVIRSRNCKLFIAGHDGDDMLSTKIPGTLNSGTPIPILLPYHSHKNPLKYGNDMEGLWEGGPTIEGPWKNP